jgi:hypothetical protein
LGAALAILVWRRNWRPLLVLIGPFVVCVATALYIGGENYRFNILTIPSLGIFYPAFALKIIAKTILENPLLYVAPVLALAVVLSARTAGKPSTDASMLVRVLGLIYLCALAGGVILCLRAGSDINYFFEAGMVASVAALPIAIFLCTRRRLLAGWFYSLGSLVLATICCIQLALYAGAANRSSMPNRLAVLGTSDFGRLRLLTSAQENNRRRLAALVAAAPKPVLIIDDIFSQPWHSTGGLYPAFSVDPAILKNLELRGIFKDDRIATLIRSRRFRTLIVSDPDHVSVARQSGYQSMAGAPDGSQLLELSATVPLSSTRGRGL